MSEVVIPDKLSLRKALDLLPYARNARTHNDAQVSEIAASIMEFGYTNPVLADSKGIVAGHGRTLAVNLIYATGASIRLPDGRELPFGTVPVMDCEGWSETKRKAYILADNKIALNSDWDVSMLKLELQELQAENFDLSLTGFGDAELAELFEPEEVSNGKDPDAVPDMPAEPHSKPGDIWICGPHKIMCGDSLSITDWDRLMGTEQADMVWTDPPYNVDIGAKNEDLDRLDGGSRAKTGGIKNDKMSNSNFAEFLLGAFTTLFAVMKPGAAIYVAHADREAHNFHQTFREAGFKFSGCVVWKKNSMVLGLSDYQSMHEPILYGWKPGHKHRWYGGRKQVSVNNIGEGSPFEKQPDGRWSIRVGDEVLIVSGDATMEKMESSVVFHEKPSRSAGHPTSKPTGLITRMLKNNARCNDIIVDAFGGSGSTMIAAEMVGMCARLMELDPRFTDVQARRYYEYTGRSAVHAETGESFPIAPLVK